MYNWIIFRIKDFYFKICNKLKRNFKNFKNLKIFFNFYFCFANFCHYLINIIYLSNIFILSIYFCLNFLFYVLMIILPVFYTVFKIINVWKCFKMHRNIFEFADLFSFFSLLLKIFYLFYNLNIIYITYFFLLLFIHSN